MSEYVQLSVLMPVYNAELYLSEAVESILNQTFSEFEFIIIDDGSTDSSLSILQAYAKKDKRIRLVFRENKGLVETLNEGLLLANGELIARMDADDISLPTRFEKQMAYLKSNVACLLLGCRVIIIDSDGDEICEMGDYFTHKELDDGFLARKGQLIYHPSVMMRKEIIDSINGYRKKYPHVEDLDLFLRVSELGKIENLKEPLLKYREHLTKVGHVHGLQQSEEIYELLVEASERRGLKDYKIKKEPISDISTSDRFGLWGWWALGAGNVKTARKYARKLFFKKPMKINSWRLLLCSLRGY